MAPDQTEYSDEYIAGVLKKDAQGSSIKYSTIGLQAYLPTRPTGAAPKLNTRFLKNILRETDTHNAALLAKEQHEARARQRALKAGQSACSRTDARPPKRRRMVGDETERRGDGRLERYEDDDDDGPRFNRLDKDKSRRSRSPGRHSSVRQHTKASSRSRSPNRRHGGRDDMFDINRREHRASRHKSREEPRRSVSRDERERESSRRYRSRERLHHVSHRTSYDGLRPHPLSQSPDRRPRPRRSSGKRRRSRSSSTSISPESNVKKASMNPQPLQRLTTPSDSDPLEAIVGPAPPSPAPRIVKRGRGAFASSSAIDSRFAEGYDPNVDVHPGSDLEDDWDQALEALRDRQKWKQQGAERLRSAGFSEADVKKWEKGGDKDESDVKWTKRGEGREWDRGKVIDEDGQIDLKPEWGRLKST